MSSHTTASFLHLPSLRQLSSRQQSFRQLGATLCLSGALAAALGGCATLNSSPSASAETSSESTAASHATAPVIQDSEGFRVFVEDLGVRASAGSPLFCGVVTSDSTASWNVTTLGGRA